MYGESSAHKRAHKFNDASTLGGGRDIIPTLKGEQNLSDFRVNRFPALSCGPYNVPDTLFVNAETAYGVASSKDKSLRCDGHAASCGSTSVFEFADVGLTMECDGCCALRDISAEGGNKPTGVPRFYNGV